MEPADANLITAMAAAATDLEHLVELAEGRLGNRSLQFMTANETMIAMMAGRASDIAAMLRREAERAASPDDAEYRRGLLKLAGWVGATIVAILIGVGLTTDDLDLHWIPGIDALAPHTQEGLSDLTSVDHMTAQASWPDGEQALHDDGANLRTPMSLSGLSARLHSLVRIVASPNSTRAGVLVGDDRTIVMLAPSPSDLFPETTAEVLSLNGGRGQARVVHYEEDPNGGSIVVLRSASPLGPPLMLRPSEHLTIGDGVSIISLNENGAELRAEALAGTVNGLTSEGLISLSGIQVGRGYFGAPVLDQSGAIVGLIVRTKDPQSALGGLAMPSDRIGAALRLVQ